MNMLVFTGVAILVWLGVTAVQGRIGVGHVGRLAAVGAGRRSSGRTSRPTAMRPEAGASSGPSGRSRTAQPRSPMGRRSHRSRCCAGRSGKPRRGGACRRLPAGDHADRACRARTAGLWWDPHGRARPGALRRHPGRLVRPRARLTLHTAWGAPSRRRTGSSTPWSPGSPSGHRGASSCMWISFGSPGRSRRGPPPRWDVPVRADGGARRPHAAATCGVGSRAISRGGPTPRPFRGASRGVPLAARGAAGDGGARRANGGLGQRRCVRASSPPHSQRLVELEPPRYRDLRRPWRRSRMRGR